VPHRTRRKQRIRIPTRRRVEAVASRAAKISAKKRRDSNKQKKQEMKKRYARLAALE